MIPLPACKITGDRKDLGVKHMLLTGNARFRRNSPSDLVRARGRHKERVPKSKRVANTTYNTAETSSSSVLQGLVHLSSSSCICGLFYRKPRYAAHACSRVRARPLCSSENIMYYTVLSLHRRRIHLPYFVDRLLPWFRGRACTTCLFGFRFCLVL